MRWTEVLVVSCLSGGAVRVSSDGECRVISDRMTVMRGFVVRAVRVVRKAPLPKFVKCKQ